MKTKNIDHSTHNQRLKLLTRLRQAPVTTVEARHELDILGVAPRIFELRWYGGYNIQRFWTDGDNPGGSKHKIAKYVLFPGKWKQGDTQ